MKKFFLIFLFICMTGCSENENNPVELGIGIKVPTVSWSINETSPMATPEKTVEQYYYAYKTKNYNLAKSCFANDVLFNAKTFDQYKYVKHNIVQFVRESATGTIIPEKYFFEDFENNKDVVQVGVNVYYQGGYVDAIAYLLKKVDDKWLIYNYKSIFDCGE
jgi:hypothetical protein